MIYEISQLPNGLRIVTVPMRERKSVAIGIWIHVGGRHEEQPLNGVSHFLEHLVFKGTAARTANQIKEAVEGRGGTLNAFTSEECTCFLAKAASSHFEEVFDVLSDMVLHASLSEADIEKERDVVLEEIKMTQDQPSHFVEELLAETLWPGHALGRPITGTSETVSALTRDQIRSYRDSFYNPELITVVAAGDLSQAALVRACQTRFGASSGRPGKKYERFVIGQKSSPIKIFDKQTEQTHLALGLHTFAKEDPDEYSLDILSVLLGGNMSSRLFNEVREERGLAYDIGASLRKYHETGAFVVSAGVDGGKLEEAVRVILKELEKTAEEPVSADELRRAKDFYLGQLDLSLENSMNNMLWAGESLVSLGRCKTPEEVAEHVRKITAEDLRRVAKRIFKSSALNLALVGPASPQLEKNLAKLLSFDSV